MTDTFTHRVIRAIPAPNDTFVEVGTLLDGTKIHTGNIVALESGEFIVALTPEEMASLNAPVSAPVEPAKPELEKPVKKVVAKKAPAKKAPAKKAPAKKTAPKTVTKSEEK
jgi:hypothetical protein